MFRRFMEHTASSQFLSRILFRAVAPVLVLGATACMSSTSARGTPLEVAKSSPAAEGQVAVERTNEGNMNLDIKVEHMAPPNRLVPGASTYVAWAQQPEGKGQPQNLGALNLGSDRSGQLKTTTGARNLKIMLTPEMSAAAKTPTGKPVMWATVSPFD
jgi:hypothetical protein